jgi:hypothetical protein
MQIGILTEPTHRNTITAQVVKMGGMHRAEEIALEVYDKLEYFLLLLQTALIEFVLIAQYIQ